MKIDIKGFEKILTEEVRKYAEEKVGKFSKYGVNIIGVDLSLEEDHNKMESKAGVARVLVKIPGKDIVARGEGKNVFAAIDEMERKVSREIREHKKKNSPKRFSKSKDAVRRLFRRS